MNTRRADVNHKRRGKDAWLTVIPVPAGLVVNCLKNNVGGDAIDNHVAVAGEAPLYAKVNASKQVSRAELIRELIDRAIGRHPGADLAADLAAISDSFGVLAGQEAFSRTRDQRMDYLDRLAGA